MIFSEVLNDLSKVIFPPQCPGCSEILYPYTAQIFCSNCTDNIKFIKGGICTICGTTFPDSPAENHLCGECLEKKPYFSYARAVFSYENIILNAIHRFKYKRNMSIGEIMSSLMADFSFPDIDFTDYSLIIPVPLHIKRLRERGFNQSLILARAIGKKRQIPVNFSLLKRRKFTTTQTGSNRNERKQNIKGAFEVSDKNKIKGENVILIDDVYTTGATVNECAKTLIEAGVRKISALTLARVLPS
ncbi:competence protein f [hydrocarbon metagenome]|uniref:Competence protein f n=1 Tax=hydrocarbon metagenome TaxID=938273 RepID=A0A0W8FUA2_9ZZZZ